jgi:hypothetical protein
MRRLLAALTAVAVLVPATAQAKTRWQAVRPFNDKLNRMAECESNRRWHINTGNGYYGGLQFDLSTWQSVKGRGMPHRNSRLEQKYRAVLLIGRRGFQPWPVCGRA